MIAKSVRYQTMNHPDFRFGIKPVDEYLKTHAERTPLKPLFNFYGTTITYGQGEHYIEQMTALLKSLGVKQGDVVGIYMQNCPQFLIALYAISRLGAIVTPFSPMFKEWDLEFELKEIKAKVIIANTYLYPVVKNVVDKTQLEHVVLTDLKYFVAKDSPVEWTLAHEDVTDTGNAIMMMESIKDLEPIYPDVKRDIDDTYLIMFTSGTTGLPKGAMLSYMNALYKANTVSVNHWISEYDRLGILQPICHIAGLVFVHSIVCVGASICIFVYPSPKATCQAVEHYKLTIAYMTALTAKNIMDWPGHKNYDLSTMRYLVSNSFGIQITDLLVKEWNEMIPGSIMVEGGYGLTETHTCDVFVPRENIVVGTHGTPTFDEMDLKIVDENGKELPNGEVGEIILKNKGIFKGYLNNPEATAEVLKDGWLYTGDAGKIEEHGYLVFIGRTKDMIKSSGFSVFPEEVEMYINRHEAVQSAAVIGRQDPVKGEVIKAFIVLMPEYKGKITEEEIIEWAKDKMATYKRPREVEFRDVLPMNSTGKMLRRVLRDEEAEKAKKA